MEEEKEANVLAEEQEQEQEVDPYEPQQETDTEANEEKQLTGDEQIEELLTMLRENKKTRTTSEQKIELQLGMPTGTFFLPAVFHALNRLTSCLRNEDLVQPCQRNDSKGVLFPDHPSDNSVLLIDIDWEEMLFGDIAAFFVMRRANDPAAALQTTLPFGRYWYRVVGQAEKVTFCVLCTLHKLKARRTAQKVALLSCCLRT